jgi:hypothetical protein
MVRRGGPRQRCRVGAAAFTRPARDARTRRVIIVALFLAVLTTGLLFGGHAAIERLLKSAEQTRAAMGTGDVVDTMPDGIFWLSFDNLTAKIR